MGTTQLVDISQLNTNNTLTIDTTNNTLNLAGILNVTSNVVVVGNLSVGTTPQSNSIAIVNGVNSTLILLNSLGTSYGVIANPNNQIWTLGCQTSAANSLPLQNVLCWGSPTAVVPGGSGQFVGISGGSPIAFANGSAVGVGSGRAMLWMQGQASNKDCLIGFANDTNQLLGYVFTTNTEMRILAAQAQPLTMFTNGLQRLQCLANGGISMNGLTTGTGTALQAITGSNNLVVVASSSIRFKTNVENLWANVSSKVLDLRPVWYRSNTDTTIDPANNSYIGLIAEEVANIEPRIVTYDLDGSPRSVSYERLSVMLIGVIKDQQNTINDLVTRVAALEAK